MKYGGYTCYKFSYNNKTVYVTTSTFYRQQKATVTRSVSDVSTTAINTGDSDKKYTTVIKSTPYTYNGMKVFHWSFARVGVRTYHAKNYSEIGMGVSVDQAYEFDAYYSGLQDISSAKMKITPTAAIRVTQSPNGLYFDSYEFRGKGDDTSKTSMGRIVEIAFLAKKSYRHCFRFCTYGWNNLLCFWRNSESFQNKSVYPEKLFNGFNPIIKFQKIYIQV